jgi:hypothetical protein
MNISRQTKRDIIDTLRVENIQWHGILDEISFLERVFNLDELPGCIEFPAGVSTSIRTEIKYYLDNPHRYDWNLYDDRRFNLIERDDETFLKFLCEMLHSIVRPDGFEVLHLLKIFNQYLALDRWEIFEIIRIGDKPIFSVRQFPQFPVNKLEIVMRELDTDYVHRKIISMESSIETNPDSAIGAAKNFVETICKTILNLKTVSFDEKNIELTKLVGDTRKQLKLLKEDVPDSAKATESIEKLLGNLGAMPEYLGQLRNKYGDGHGKDAYFKKGLQPKEARLAVNAAIALGVYLLETYLEQKTES